MNNGKKAIGKNSRSNKENRLSANSPNPLIHVLWKTNYILDFDLAKLYGVKPSEIRNAYRHNHERFHPIFRHLDFGRGFVRALSREEVQHLVAAEGIPPVAQYSDKRPILAFDSTGAMVISFFLNSRRAKKASAAFALVLMYHDMAVRFLLKQRENSEALEELFNEEGVVCQPIFDAIRALQAPPSRLGFPLE